MPSKADGAAASRRVHEIVEELTQQVVAALTRRAEAGRTFHIEEIQDQVELALMRGEHHKVARAYVLYREERAKAAGSCKAGCAQRPTPALNVKRADGSLAPLDDAPPRCKSIEEACAGLSDVAAEPILAETRRNLYDGITPDELALAPIMAARTLIEQEPNYAYVSARLLLDKLRARRCRSCMAGRAGDAGRDGRRAMPSISRPTSRPASRPSCSIRSSAASTWRGSPPR